MVNAVQARKLDIPLVSMLDTNCDPDLCEVPIPYNAMQCVPCN